MPLVSIRAVGELVHFLLPVQGRVVTMQVARVQWGISQASSWRSAASPRVSPCCRPTLSPASDVSTRRTAGMLSL